MKKQNGSGIKYLYKIFVDVANKENRKGQLITKRDLKFKRKSFFVYSKDSSKVLEKAGARMNSEGWVFKDIEVINP
jgi:hypothetical protein